MMLHTTIVPAENAVAAFGSTFAALPLEPSRLQVRRDGIVIDGIEVSILRRGDNSVTLRADALCEAWDGACPAFTPVWSFVPLRRGASLSIGADSQTATLTGPAGRYEVQASFYSATGCRLSGRAIVTID